MEIQFENMLEEIFLQTKDLEEHGYFVEFESCSSNKEASVKVYCIDELDSSIKYLSFKHIPNRLWERFQSEIKRITDKYYPGDAIVDLSERFNEDSEKHCVIEIAVC